MPNRKTDYSFTWLTQQFGEEWEPWRIAATAFVGSLDKPSQSLMGSLSMYFTKIMIPFDVPREPATFLRSGNAPPLDILTSRSRNRSVRIRTHNHVVRFFHFVINEHLECPNLTNPYEWAGNFTGQSTDETFSWLTRIYGQEWEAWRYLAASYLESQEGSKSVILAAFNKFFSEYLVKDNTLSNVASFFSADRSDLWILFSDTAQGYKGYNKIVELMDWIREHHFSEPDDKGNLIPSAPRPLEKKWKKCKKKNETNKQNIPYSYIEELRELICPSAAQTFGDWSWAQTAFGMDWFECDPALIDENDPECVWKTTTVERVDQVRRKVTVTKMWSPVRAVALLLKLHLPLRSYQVRMLDSGEADTWRYENGEWFLSTTALAMGSRDAPYEEGVFRRIRDENAASSIVTGIYVNTNKTADQNVDQDESGYTIPWEHETVLYWLERLRNWQERYNPIQNRTSCSTLSRKELGHVKSKTDLAAMGSKCFLFRDPKSDEPYKPLHVDSLEAPWYRTLYALEQALWDRGETLVNGDPVRLTDDDDKPWSQRSTTLFPLHSLRVSLITSLIMDGGVPLPVVSKLIAGHSRLMMTLFYTKISTTRITDELARAHGRMSEEGKREAQRFLEEKSADAIHQAMISHDGATTDALLRGSNPVGWVRVLSGICLAGRYNGEPETDRDVAGCHNGGALVRKGGSGGAQGVYGRVRHGPENCVACRFLLTSAEFLDGLRACFNAASYKASEAANRAVRHEAEKERLEKELGGATRDSQKIRSDIKDEKQRYRTQLQEADEYCQDMIDAYRLIVRVIDVERSRDATYDETEGGQALVSPAAADALQDAIQVRETNSPLWQIADLCEDAEVYPRVGDDLAKTNAVEKRSRLLDRKLKREGFEPIFMEMDEDMQLKQGNALLRGMAARLEPDTPRQDGLRRVCGLIEANEALTDLLGNSLAEAGPLNASDAPIGLEDMRCDNDE